MAQTVSDHQVCIYDNASNDETQDLAQALTREDSRVSYHRHAQNIGALANFIFGMERVETPYFAFLSDDDVVLPNFLATTLDALRSHPTAMFAATQVLNVRSNGVALERHGQWTSRLYEPPEGLYSVLRFLLPAWTGTLFRREAIQSIGLLDPRAGMAADLDFQVRLAARHPFVIDLTPGGLCFQHDESITGSKRVANVWPTWQHILIRLESDKDLPPAVRDRACQIFASRLTQRLFEVGISASLSRNEAEAEKATTVLRREFDLPWHAGTLRLLQVACRVPGIAPFLSELSLRLRSGWRPVPDRASYDMALPAPMRRRPTQIR